MANRLFNTIRFALEKKVADIFGAITFSSGVASLVAGQCHGIASIESHPGLVQATANAVLATQTIGTHSEADFQVLNLVAGDAVDVNGVTFTAVLGPVVAPDDFSLGAHDGQAVSNLISAINGSTSVGVLSTVYASADPLDPRKVLLYAMTPGVAGDLLTLSTSDATITVSGATFGGGTDGDSLVIDGIAFEVVDALLGSVKPYEVLAGSGEAETIANLVAVFNDIWNGATAEVDGTTPEQANFTITTPGAAGNSTTIVDGGVGGFTPSAATFTGGDDRVGVYALTLDKSAHRLLSAEAHFKDAGAPAAPVMTVNSFVPGSGAVLTVQFATPTGTATDPGDTEVLHLDIAITDTSAV